MAIVAQVIDGKVVANYTDGKANKKTGSDSLNKDAFFTDSCGRNAVSGST